MFDISRFVHIYAPSVIYFHEAVPTNIWILYINVWKIFEYEMENGIYFEFINFFVYEYLHRSGALVATQTHLLQWNFLLHRKELCKQNLKTATY